MISYTCTCKNVLICIVYLEFWGNLNRLPDYTNTVGQTVISAVKKTKKKKGKYKEKQ